MERLDEIVRRVLADARDRVEERAGAVLSRPGEVAREGSNRSAREEMVGCASASERLTRAVARCAQGRPGGRR